MPKHVKTTVKRHQQVDTNRLLGYVYSNEFSVLQQDQYDFISSVIHRPGNHTEIGKGQYEVSPDAPLAKLFTRYFDICQYKTTDLDGTKIDGIKEIERIRIQETGLGVVGNSKQDYEKLESNRARFIFNFRPVEVKGGLKREANSYVALDIRLSKSAAVSIPLVRSFATVVPEALSAISIDSGNQVGHRTQGRSIYVIIDCLVHNNILNLIANKMMASSPISGDQILKALEQLQKDNGLGSLKEGFAALAGDE